MYKLPDRIFDLGKLLFLCGFIGLVSTVIFKHLGSISRTEISGIVGSIETLMPLISIMILLVGVALIYLGIKDSVEND